MTPARSLGALALACALIACGGDKTVRIPLHLMAGEACEEDPFMGPLLCGGTLVLQLYVREATGDRLLGAPHCVPFDVQESGLAALDAILAADPPDFGVLAGGEVFARAAVFTPGLLGCPTLGEDPFNETSRFPTAQGQSVPIELTPDATISIPLTCFQPPAEACAGSDPVPKVADITATVTDLGTLVSQGESFAVGGASVEAGYVDLFFEKDGSTTREIWTFLSSGVLGYTAGGIWTASLDSLAFFPTCIGAMVYRDPGPPVASCDAVYDDTTQKAFVAGYTIDAATVASLARALGHTSMPSDGLVIGRVLDAQRRPVAGARVTALLIPEVVIKTPTADFSGLTADGRTSATGWFVIDADGFAPSGIRCCTELQADHQIAGSGMTRPLGLLEGFVLGTTIEIRQPE